MEQLMVRRAYRNGIKQLPVKLFRSFFDVPHNLMRESFETYSYSPI